MEYLRYVRILWKRYCKCKKITAPTWQIERLFFYLMSRITRLSVTPLYKQYNILATTFQYVFVCYLYLSSIFPTSNSPHPCWFLGNPISTELSRSLSFTSLFDMSGKRSNKRATAPETIGVLMEVPLLIVYLSALLEQLTTLQPGATRSGLQMQAAVGPRPE